MTKRSKKAWTKWRRLVSEQACSGQSVKAFCRNHGLCRPYFFVWKKRLQGSAAAKFLEVQMAGRVSSTSGAAGGQGTISQIRAGANLEPEGLPRHVAD
jgi:transposase-like protein